MEIANQQKPDLMADSEKMEPKEKVTLVQQLQCNVVSYNDFWNLCIVLHAYLHDGPFSSLGGAGLVR